MLETKHSPVNGPGTATRAINEMTTSGPAQPLIQSPKTRPRASLRSLVVGPSIRSETMTSMPGDHSAGRSAVGERLRGDAFVSNPDRWTSPRGRDRASLFRRGASEEHPDCGLDSAVHGSWARFVSNEEHAERCRRCGGRCTARHGHVGARRRGVVSAPCLVNVGSSMLMSNRPFSSRLQSELNRSWG